MAVSSSRLIHWLHQVEHGNQTFGAEVKMFPDQRDDATVIDSPGAEGIDTDRCGFGNSDRVRNLYFATFSNARGDYILGHVTCGVSCRAVNLGRVLAREGAAAVTRHATIGVNDNFTASPASPTGPPITNLPVGLT